MKESRVRQLVTLDAENFERAWRELEPHNDLPDEIGALYETLMEATRQCRAPGARRAVLLYLKARHHVLLGATSLFRGHAQQMFRETRSAVEAAGKAREIVANAESLKVYEADDGTDKQAKREARSWFNATRLFPDKIEKAAALKQYWTVFSDLGHAKQYTSALHLHSQPSTGNPVFTVQDITSLRDVVQLLSWMCFAHMAILELADLVFDEVTDQLGAFRSERQYLGGRVARVHDLAAPDEVQPEQAG